MGRALVGGILAAAALTVAPAGPASASAPRAHEAAAACKASQLQVWLGDGEGGGTAGHTYYPLEFSNISHSSCSLYGYPGVSAMSSNGHQIAGGAGRNSTPHGTVTLAAGATAHAIFSIADWGAICSTAVNAAGLRVYPPGLTRSWTIEFPFQACASTSVLNVGPVRAGVGVPGYTTS